MTWTIKPPLALAKEKAAWFSNPEIPDCQHLLMII
jgi:hypothetical protein